MRQIDTSSAISAHAIASNFRQSHPLSAPCSQSEIAPQYVWVTEPTVLAAKEDQRGYLMDDKVDNRYWVISPYIWQDTQPLTPCNPYGYPLSVNILSYLRLQSYSLHLPTLYGVFPPPPSPNHLKPAPHPPTVLLLDNVPVDRAGQLLPSIQTDWPTASPIRQVYWLWQLLELWHVLSRWDQTTSLLAPMNIRVDGWRIRLVNVWSNSQWRKAGGPPEPFTTGQGDTHPNNPQARDQPLHWHLGKLWQSWVNQGHSALVEPLTQICDQLKQPNVSWSRIKQDLNVVLLQYAAQQPFQLAIAGGSYDVIGRSHPMGLCYPNTLLAQSSSCANDPTQTRHDQAMHGGQTSAYDVSTGFIAPQPWEELNPYVAILCDGVNDLARGAVASQLVTRSLKLQLGALLTEIESHQTTSDLIAPDILADQLAAIVRIVNNVLLAHHHSHHHSHPVSQDSPSTVDSGQPLVTMGTTAILAVQIPQSVTTYQGSRNGHELYIASVGNSRAYWLTPTHCHCLIQDDNVAARNVLSQLGRGQLTPKGQSYHDAHLQSGSARLTQALGLKEGEHLSIQVRRLIVDEDGLLLLCSHVLGDRVETHWQALTTRILQNELSLDDGIQAWLELLAPSPQPALKERQTDIDQPEHPQSIEREPQTESYPHASVVVMRCQVSDPQVSVPPSSLPHVPNLDGDRPLSIPSDPSEPDRRPTVEFPASQQEPPAEPTPSSDDALAIMTAERQEDARTDRVSWHWPQRAFGGMALMIAAIAIGLTTWRYLDPVLFDRVVVRSTEQFIKRLQDIYPGDGSELTED